MGIDMMLNQQIMEFHVVTTLALHGSFDKEPINDAMNYHLKNKGITRVHILTETPVDALRAAIPVLNDDRVSLISVHQRPLFKDLFDYCNRLANKEKSVVSLMNADVSFESNDDIERCLSTLDACRQRGHNAVLTISRRDRRGEQFGLFLRDQTGMPNFVSADCWVFFPPITPIGVDFFAMGQMNCDLMVTFALTESSQVLLNPCVDISVLHHEREEKTEDFYRKENLKKTTQDLNNWHWAKKCIVPFHYFGVLWNRIEWIKRGYLPAPIQDFGKKRIYLCVAGTISEKFEQYLLFITEIISRCNDLDLVVMGENIYEVNADLIGKIGLVSRNTYFIQVDSLKEVSLNLISEAKGRHESVAWISNFGLLTPNLLQEFHSVILDIRHYDSVRHINVPPGHTYLRGFVSARYDIEVDEQFIFEPQSSQMSSCTLITTLYKSDPFILGFRENISALDGYENFVHVILFSQLSELEQETLISWRSEYSNVILGFFRKDPGLYECWNIGIRLAPTEYVSNANVDDLRHPLHVSSLVECLNQMPHIAVTASAIIAFDIYTSKLEDIDVSQPWFVDEAGEFGMEKLAHLGRNERGNWTLVPHNIPHCSPVWRKALHDKYGYFDEQRFGTYADGAFWLKITKQGEKGYLDPRPYAYYYINLASHNRRGDRLKELHQELEREFLDAIYFRQKEGTRSEVDGVQSAICPKLNLKGLDFFFGQHRYSSYSLLVEPLMPLHDENASVVYVPFIERRFAWGADDGEAASANPQPIQNDWIGMLHVPFDAPKWFAYDVNPEYIFQTELWNQSLPTCRGIICPTKDMQYDLARWYPDIPSIAVKVPVELNVKRFDWDAYISKPKLIQVGDWLRKLQAIYMIEASEHEKIILLKQHTALFLQREIEAIGDYRNHSVKVFDFLSNEEYDELLSSSVVLLWLYGTAANNAVIECIARCTPLLVNPLPGVVEYLGSDYPLYIESLEDASKLLADKDKIRKGYDYLLSNERLRQELTYERFFTSIASSDFYANL